MRMSVDFPSRSVKGEIVWKGHSLDALPMVEGCSKIFHDQVGDTFSCALRRIRPSSKSWIAGSLIDRVAHGFFPYLTVPPTFTGIIRTSMTIFPHCKNFAFVLMLSCIRASEGQAAPLYLYGFIIALYLRRLLMH